MDIIKTILSIVLWMPMFVVKLLLVLIGLVAVPFTHPDHRIWGNNEHPYAPHWYMPGKNKKWREYMWRAIRNPVNNLRFLIPEPLISEFNGYESPDEVVRRLRLGPAWKFTRASLFSEFWFLDYSETFDRYFEFRIGWKFGSTPGFGFTFQLRFGKT